MTTITEILAEAFNRVKAEHGVTLSRVEYVDTGGVLVLNFKAAGSVATRGNFGDGELVEMTPEKLDDIVKPRVPDYTYVGFWQNATPLLGGQVPIAPPWPVQEPQPLNPDNDELVEMTPEKREELRMVLIRQKAPKGSTHYGSLSGSENRYWTLKEPFLFYQDKYGCVVPYQLPNHTTAAELAATLTPLT